MTQAVQAVISFVEGPDVDGSRDLPVETVIEIILHPETTLPDLGVAPTAMLLSACERSLVQLDSLPLSPTFEEWLQVSGHETMTLTLLFIQSYVRAWLCAGTT